MRVNVIQKFKDKYSGEMHNVGDKLNLKRERVDEILRVGNFVEEIKKEKDTEASE